VAWGSADGEEALSGACSISMVSGSSVRLGGGSVGSFTMASCFWVELEWLSGSFDNVRFGALGGLAGLVLLEVRGRGALAAASLSIDAWRAETMVAVEMRTLLRK